MEDEKEVLSARSNGYIVKTLKTKKHPRVPPLSGTP